MSNTKLTFENFVQGLVDQFKITSDVIHIVPLGTSIYKKRGWYFSGSTDSGDYLCVKKFPIEHNILGGGSIRYSHEIGYTIHCRGKAEKLTLEEVGKLFDKNIPGEGTFVGSFQAESNFK